MQSSFRGCLLLEAAAGPRKASAPCFSTRKPGLSRRLACRGSPVVRAEKGGPAPPPLSKTEKELQALLPLLVRYPGIYGSAAVLLGYVLHIPATGHFHLDAADALLGLKLAVPAMVLDSLLMVPNYSPGTKLKQVKIKVPRAVAEKMAQQQQQQQQQQGAGRAGANSSTKSSSGGGGGNGDGAVKAATVAAPDSARSSSGAGGELVEVEHAFPISVEQPPLLAALNRLQTEKAGRNAALGLSVPSELAVLFTYQLASEMLWRGVVLVALSGVFTDLLYACGADDLLYSLGGDLHAAVPQVGAVCAVLLCTAVAAWSVIQRELYPLRLVEMLEQAAKRRRSGGKRGGGGQQPELGQVQPPSPPQQQQQQEEGDGGKEEAEESSGRLNKLLSKMRTKLSSQRKWAMAIEVARQSSEIVAYSAAFLLTGNLLAPYVAACTNDLLFSIYQRARQAAIEREQREALERLGAVAATMAELRGAKLERLQPRKQPGGRGGGGSSKGSDG